MATTPRAGAYTLVPHDDGEQVWAHFGVEQPYGASCGITLSPDLHAMYERYAFSFYPSGNGRYTLHFFEPQCDIYHCFHGKEISRDAFHTVDDYEIPFDEYFR
ncbi:BZ3500_MvSof-1268-A1-R1_Chr6-3g09004 [Microbotryum saponariae]|uniref:BZ3500_MvSof-1268-A1-R1_Chr6-3g09004 protein n=1 Tax=Microbotryum saponariae TaxID=289078 RepID=A0A2X0NN36_9BASI|nr:BZ3500_MvSof-1268-A1-R1_Chr6-3g09004 [Microbotryum saponariae]SDA07606.1 BZ3501_MvSof-1269-A2-R1_Chr6-2g08708 [Microbotryum saponariae]